MTEVVFLPGSLRSPRPVCYHGSDSGPVATPRTDPVCEDPWATSTRNLVLRCVHICLNGSDQWGFTLRCPLIGGQQPSSTVMLDLWMKPLPHCTNTSQVFSHLVSFHHLITCTPHSLGKKRFLKKEQEFVCFWNFTGKNFNTFPETKRSQKRRSRHRIRRIQPCSLKFCCDRRLKLPSPKENKHLIKHI